MKKVLAAVVILFITLGALCFILVRQFGRAVLDQIAAHQPQLEQIATSNGYGNIEAAGEELSKQALAQKVDIDALRAQRRSTMPSLRLSIPINLDAMTSEKLVERMLPYRLRELDAYLDLTKDTGEAKAAVKKFLKAYLTLAVTQQFTNQTHKQLAAEAKAAFESGSQDPLFLTFYARAMWGGDDNNAVYEMWTRAIRELPASKYPKKVEFYARSFQYDLANLKDPRQTQWRQLVQAAVAWMEEEGGDSPWLRCYFEPIWGLWQSAPSPFDQSIMLLALLQSSKSDPYVKHVLLGDFYVTIGWMHRSTQVASKLNRQQIIQFEHCLKKAGVHFLAAWQSHPELPFAAERMIVVSQAGYDADRPDFWFVQSVNAEFDYYPAYETLLDALLPRWGGSHADMIQFGRNCLNTDRFKSTVPYFGLDVLEKMEAYEKVQIIKNPAGVRLLQDLVAARNKYRTAHPQDRLFEDGGKYRASLMKRLDQADETDLLVEELKRAGDVLNWRYLREGMRASRFEVALLLAGPKSTRSRWLELGHRLREPKSFPGNTDAIAVWQQEFEDLKALRTPEDGTTFAIDEQVEILLEQWRSYLAGDWTSLPMNDDLPGWEPYCDWWNKAGQNSVQLSNRGGEARQVCLRPLANFQLPLEIEATLEIEEPEPYSYGVGIGWSREGLDENLLEQRPESLPAFGIQAERRRNGREDHALLWTGSSIYPTGRVLSTTGPHRMRLKFWKNHVELLVDEITVLNKEIYRQPDPDGWLCFGETIPHSRRTHFSAATGSFRWTDIRLRHLKQSAPPSVTEPFEKRAVYWEERCAGDPEDLIAQIELCAIRFRQQRFDEVLETSNQLQTRYPGVHGVRKWRGMIFYDLNHDYTPALSDLKAAKDEGDYDEEIQSRVAEILVAAPDDALRNADQGYALAEQCVKYSARQNARLLAILAAACAEMGRFDLAVKEQRAAMEIASESEKKLWADRESLYESKHAYRLPVSAVEGLKNSQ